MSTHEASLERAHMRAEDAESAPFTEADLHSLGVPACVRETYTLLIRELDRKQGMVDDLKQMADSNFGLSPEDCAMLTLAVRDRNAAQAALAGLRTFFN